MLAQAPRAATPAQMHKKHQGKDATDRLAAALDKCGYKVIDPGTPLRVHSHCAGMDAVSWSIRKLGINARVLATESDPAAAAFHMMHHARKTDHIVIDIKWVAEGTSGPCFKHGGKMCTWDELCDLMFSSFVCKPYSAQSAKRLKSALPDVGYDPHGVDTYHHTKAAIARYRPRALVLENVSGVAASHPEDEPTGKTPKRKMPSPAEFMLSDLRSAGCDVALLPSIKASEVAGMCQSRPRALFFGVRHGENIDLDSVVRPFKNFGQAYEALGETDRIDDFLDAAACGAAAVGEDAVGTKTAGGEDAEFEYLSEYTNVHEILRAALRAKQLELSLPSTTKTDRPSESVPAESVRVRTTIDILAHINKMHTPMCPGAPGCSCHPLADISQRADRVNWRIDGSIPTLTTESNTSSYKLRRFISPSELALPMGYGPKFSLAPFTATAAQTLVGNGYCVPVCALGVAAAASVAGCVVPKTAPLTGSSKTHRFF